MISKVRDKRVVIDLDDSEISAGKVLVTDAQVLSGKFSFLTVMEIHGQILVMEKSEKMKKKFTENSTKSQMLGIGEIFKI